MDGSVDTGRVDGGTKVFGRNESLGEGEGRANVSSASESKVGWCADLRLVRERIRVKPDAGCTLCR